MQAPIPVKPWTNHRLAVWNSRYRIKENLNWYTKVMYSNATRRRIKRNTGYASSQDAAFHSIRLWKIYFWSSMVSIFMSKILTIFRSKFYAVKWRNGSYWKQHPLQEFMMKKSAKRIFRMVQQPFFQPLLNLVCIPNKNDNIPLLECFSYIQDLIWARHGERTLQQYRHLQCLRFRHTIAKRQLESDFF